MRVVLISTYDKIEATGLRILASCLKRAGFDTPMVFLADIERPMTGAAHGCRDIPARALQQVVSLCEDAGLVGLSVMTATFHEARQVTDAIHAALDVPVIWGGVHPTVRPEECLQYADLVCIGEGERAILELAGKIQERRDYRDVHNLALRDSGSLITNPLSPLESDLDALPFPDHDYKQHHILHDGHLEPCRPGLIYFHLCSLASWAAGPVYSVLTSRGCPYRCAYCINHVLARIYPDWCRVRRRSPENIIAEIRAVRGRLPGIEAIDIRDETFLASPRPYIAAFSQRYQQEVGLPFRAYTAPQTADPTKLRQLAKAGLREIMLGVQTGSPRVLELYARRATNKQVVRAAEAMHSLRRWNCRSRHDVITDNPYATEADRFETLMLIHCLPRPFKLSLYSLALLPGTKLRERAVSDGLLDQGDRTVYQHSFIRIQANGYNLLLMCHSWNLPRPLLYLLTRRVVFSLLSRGLADRLCGWVLERLAALRLRRNRKLTAQSRLRWLGSRETTEAG